MIACFVVFFKNNIIVPFPKKYSFQLSVGMLCDEINDFVTAAPDIGYFFPIWYSKSRCDDLKHLLNQLYLFLPEGRRHIP